MCHSQEHNYFTIEIKGLFLKICCVLKEAYDRHRR